MEVKLLLLMNFVIAANCRSTISNRNDATREYALFVDMKFEMGSIHQLLMNLQQDAVSSVTLAIQEMKSEIEEIRQIVIQLKNGIAAQPMHEMRSDIGEIHQIVLKQQNCNDTQATHELNMKTEEIRQIVLRQHGNETQAMQEIKSKTEEIRQIALKQHGNETQAMQEMRSKTEEIRQIVLKHHGNETQAMQEMKSKTEEIRQLVLGQHCNETQAMKEIKSKTEEIRQAVIQQLSRPRKECPFGFDYLPEVGRCFMFVFENMTWNNAAERCRGIMPGVHLAVIRSQEENDAITEYLQSQFSKNSTGSSQQLVNDAYNYAVWISGQNKNPGRCEGPFVWKTLIGVEIPFNYTNWARNEPNCVGGESCVQIVPFKSYAWNDWRCSKSSYPLCEI